ncbi:ATP-binding protein [uncultured Methylobacterium sp.]|uniref:ATP-binding protein n=1 Tax=uncultured Methylobacterium sp. TaxID=157278 RepID=UPI002610A783|nr:ATP-binding protein [uncultured Methylobacterium sp.]
MPDLPAPDETPDATLRAALAAAPLPSVLLDPAGAGCPVIYANPAALALTGETEAEWCGRGLPELGADRGGQAALRVLVAAGGPGRTEALIRRRDGATLWAGLHLSPVPGGGLLLGQWVELSRARDLEAALAQAQRRETLGQLTNGVAHEFNNLLQILVGYVDGLKRRLGDHPDPFVQRALLRSTDAAERASTLTRHLLAFSRKHRPEPRPVDLARLLADYAPRARDLLGPGIVLDIQAEPGLWTACVDPIQTELILQIVLANARDAMPEGGSVALSAANHGGEGLAEDGTLGRHVVLTAVDTGTGMAPEVLARALEPFFTTREPGRGTGLAILNALVKRQNGTVTLRSSVGTGTLLRLTFPAVEEAAPRRAVARTASVEITRKDAAL